jgi:tetratricopeptide (TPR) repeat protein
LDTEELKLRINMKRMMFLLAAAGLLMATCASTGSNTANTGSTTKKLTGRSGRYYDRGNIYYDQAIADYNKAIELDPNGATASTYYRRGESYYQTDEKDKVIADCNKAIELDPGYADAWLRGAIALSDTGDNTKALIYVNKAGNTHARLTLIPVTMLLPIKSMIQGRLTEEAVQKEDYKNPVYTGMVTDFMREYNQNEYAAKAKYNGKIVRLTGTIGDITDGYPSLFGQAYDRHVYQIHVDGGFIFQHRRFRGMQITLNKRHITPAKCNRPVD